MVSLIDCIFSDTMTQRGDIFVLGTFIPHHSGLQFTVKPNFHHFNALLLCIYFASSHIYALFTFEWQKLHWSKKNSATLLPFLLLCSTSFFYQLLCAKKNCPKNAHTLWALLFNLQCTSFYSSCLIDTKKKLLLVFFKESKMFLSKLSYSRVYKPLFFSSRRKNFSTGPFVKNRTNYAVASSLLSEFFSSFFFFYSPKFVVFWVFFIFFLSLHRNWSLNALF